MLVFSGQGSYVFYLFQIFGIKLMSHLSCQFALPKSLSVAKLCINVMFAMVGGRC